MLTLLDPLYLPSKQRPMPALLNSSGTSSHSLGRTLCRGITYSHDSSSSAAPAAAGGFLCTAGAECARESFPDFALNLAPWTNSGKLAATAASRAAAMAVCCCCCFGMGLREPLLDAGDPVWSSPLLLLPVVGEGVHGSEVVPVSGA